LRSSNRQRRSIAHGTLLMALLCSASVVAGEGDGKGAGVLPSPEELEASGAVIGQVTVVVGDVFDTSIDGEDGWLYRSANKLHIETRPKVIEDQLLFKPGEPYRRRLVLETERILRANNYLYEAVIVPVAYDGQVVDLEVRTRDVWTLNPGISFSRSGGENTFAAQIQEDNLLGTGQKIDLEWESDVDRESLALTYFNPHFLESFTRLTATYVDSDDGSEKIFGLARPFYALDVRRAGGVYLADGERIESRYQLGKVTGEFEHRDEYYEIHGGWSRGLQGRAVRRWTAGVTYERDQFEPSPDEVLGGPLPRIASCCIRGSVSSGSRTTSRSASTRTRSSARRTCSWGCARTRGSATPRNPPAPTAMRSSRAPTCRTAQTSTQDSRCSARFPLPAGSKTARCRTVSSVPRVACTGRRRSTASSTPPSRAP